VATASGPLVAPKPARVQPPGAAISPRFTLKELVLPRPQSQQVDEVRQAMDSLTTVHYQWARARAWNEGGLAVLFSGPPGTGKTMAAEALAQALGLPMYRIDLSQVVNKYIGETEKSLKRIFDAAEISIACCSSTRRMRCSASVPK